MPIHMKPWHVPFSPVKGTLVKVLTTSGPATALLESEFGHAPRLLNLETGELRTLYGLCHVWGDYQLMFEGQRHPWANSERWGK